MSDRALLFIHALTGLHPGSGTALGVVDLPVQRERHTDWPTIPGSSLKGVMRAECVRFVGGHQEDENVLVAFGPEPGNASAHAGAVTLSDARILAFPVRSLTGVFAWVTCPAVLDRLSRDLRLVIGDQSLTVPRPRENAVACAHESPLIAHDGQLMLEEFEFSRDGDAKEIAQWIASRAVKDDATRNRIRSHLAVLCDDDFTHFVRNATEVVARVGLDYDRKTVRKGALFYEEYLPPETLFYSLVLCSDSRRRDLRRSSADIFKWLRGSVPQTLQIGSGETVGKGFCTVRFVDSETGERQ